MTDLFLNHSICNVWVLSQHTVLNPIYNALILLKNITLFGTAYLASVLAAQFIYILGMFRTET
jgi:hypothetical protein